MRVSPARCAFVVLMIVGLAGCTSSSLSWPSRSMSKLAFWKRNSSATADAARGLQDPMRPSELAARTGAGRLDLGAVLRAHHGHHRNGWQLRGHSAVSVDHAGLQRAGLVLHGATDGGLRVECYAGLSDHDSVVRQHDPLFEYGPLYGRQCLALCLTGRFFGHDGKQRP